MEQIKQFRLLAPGKFYLLASLIVLVIAYVLALGLMLLISAIFVGLFLYNCFFVRLALRRVRLDAQHSTELFAGQESSFKVAVHNEKRFPRITHLKLKLLFEDEEANEVFVPILEPNTKETLTLSLLPAERGWLKIRGYELSTSYPFGLMSYVCSRELNQKVLVYPQLLAEIPDIYRDKWRTQGSTPKNSDDFQYLDRYQDGDDVRLIHWRKSTLLPQPVIKKDLAHSEIEEPRIFVPDACDHFEHAISAVATWFYYNDVAGWSIVDEDGVRHVETREEMLHYLSLIKPLNRVPDLTEYEDLLLFASQCTPN